MLKSVLLIVIAVCVAAGPALAADGAPAKEGPSDMEDYESSMNAVAEKYVKLVLSAGEHDDNYVDAYYGPAEWKERAAEYKVALEKIEKDAAKLAARLATMDMSGQDEMLRLRHGFLSGQVKALHTYARILSGEKLSFDEESKGLYDIEAGQYDEGYFLERLEKIEKIVPAGEEALPERLKAYRDGFVIPSDRLEAVFDKAIEEARMRTKKYIELPEGESFTVEYVTGTSWGAYNWYKGNAHSLIQVNTDLPTRIDSPLSLACHEGYPGHHVYNVLLESHLAKGKGWIEYTIYPLYSPQSLLAEGTANYATELTFPGGERLGYEKEALYPMAGLDAGKAEEYATVQKLAKELSKARIVAARRYLNGEATREEAAEYLTKYALLSPERAGKLVDFFDQYRSYIVNYYVGHDLVKEYIESRAGEEGSLKKRWELFRELLSTPRIPSDLR